MPGDAPNKTILIVGAGPTGLVLALWLTKLKVAVRIIDKLALPGTTSRALAVQARTLEFYRQIGIADDVVDGGLKMLGINIWVRGKRAARAPLGEIGKGLSEFSFALIYPQDAHEKLLIEKLAAQGVYVERETELISLEQDVDTVRAVIRSKDNTEETVHAAYVAGCDGASSTVRHQIGIGFPGGTYEGLFYVADISADGPIIENELNVDLEEADFLLAFPLQGKRNLRLVGYAGEGVRAQHDKLSFDDVKGRAVEHLKLRTIKVNWFSTYHVHHRVANRFRKDRVFLLGDAAHVHSPVGGQGMNTGIGDAVNLAWKVAAVMKGEAGAQLLDTFEPERIAFAQRLIATTDRGFTIATAKGRLAQFFRTRLVPLITPIGVRLPLFRRFLFRTVSQINVAYKESTLSEGKAGRIQGGERLPWFRNGATDNFEPLSSLKWQVHVYGESRPGLKKVCADLGIELHEFAWGADSHGAGFKRNALYLVRPDGYVALADPESSSRKLRDYFTSRKLQIARF